jgi:hypothetical protein
VVQVGLRWRLVFGHTALLLCLHVGYVDGATAISVKLVENAEDHVYIFLLALVHCNLHCGIAKCMSRMHRLVQVIAQHTKRSAAAARTSCWDREYIATVDIATVE